MKRTLQYVWTVGLGLALAGGIVANAQPVHANTRARINTVGNDPVISAITSVVPSSTTAAATTTYTVAFTTASDLSGGSLVFDFQQNGCPNNVDWQQCAVNMAHANLVSGVSGNLNTWNTGFSIQLTSALVAGDHTLVIGGVINPNTLGSYYRAAGFTTAEGQPGGGPEQARTPSEPFFFLTPAVKGTLTLPGGLAVAQAGVNFHTQNFSFQTNTGTDQWGFYAISSAGIANGTYLLDYWVMDINGYIAPAPVELTYAGTTITHDAQLVTASKTLTGHVRYQDGSPVLTGGQVFLNKRGGMGSKNAELSAAGTYSVSLDGGDWDANLSAGWDQNSPRQVDWSYSQQSQGVSFVPDTTVENKTLDFTVIKTNAQVRGRILKPNGQPMDHASVELRQGTGQGSSTGVDPDGRFTINVQDGTYTLNIWTDQSQPGYALMYYPGTTITVNAQQTLDVGDIGLLEKTSRITGRVTLENGSPVAGLSINCNQQNSFGWGQGQTDASGAFAVGVMPGTWQCDIDRNPNQVVSYILLENQPRASYTLGQNETVTGVNFTVRIADARLNVRLVDRNGAALSDMFGYAYAREQGTQMMPGNDYGSGIDHGTAAIALLGGKTYIVGVNTPSDQSNYLLESEVEVTIGQGEQKSITLTMVAPDAHVVGYVQDQNGHAITNVDAEVNVGTDNGGMWRNARLRPDGSYELPVQGGKTYFINYFFHNSTDFVQSNSDTAPFTVPVNGTVTKILTAFRADSRVTARVLTPSGSALPSGYVWCSNEMYLKDKITGDIKGGRAIHAGSDIRNGVATVALVSGKYQCGTGNTPGQNLYMPPESIEIEVTPTAPADITLQYRQADASLRGTALLSTGAAPSRGWCHAVEAGKMTSDKKGAGGFSGGELMNGSFTVPLTLGTWYVGCDSPTGEAFYRSEEKIITISAKGEVTQNFTLDRQSWNLPQGMTTTFDSTAQKSLTLPDGTTLTIPANALATDGNVTLIASPTVNIYHTPDTKPVNFAWDFSALDSSNQLIESFNSNVNICIPYDQAQLDAEGIAEDDLVAKYYNTTSGSWQMPDGVTQDTVSKNVCFAVNHFTSFALATGGAAFSQSNNFDIIATPIGQGGPQVVITDETGKVVSSFFAYAKTLRVGIEAVTGDVDGDGQVEVITAAGTGAGPQIRVFTRTGQLKKQFFAYDSRLRTGMHVVTGDVNGDGMAEIITSLMAGGKPEIAVYSGAGKTIKRFYAYAQTFLGGLNIKTGDVNGDGVDEIITAPDSKGGPQIAVYTGAGKTLKRFMAYASNVRGGYNLATGDMNFDGTADIVVAPKAGNGPQVASFTGNGSLIKRFMAYASTFRGGVNIAIGDTNGDGSNAIVTSPMSNAGPQIRVFNAKGEVKSQFWAYASRLRGNFMALAMDVNGDSTAEIITAPGAGMGPQVRVFNQAGTPLHSFFTHHTGFRGGISIAPALSQ